MLAILVGPSLCTAKAVVELVRLGSGASLWLIAVVSVTRVCNGASCSLLRVSTGTCCIRAAELFEGVVVTLVVAGGGATSTRSLLTMEEAIIMELPLRGGGAFSVLSFAGACVG